MNARLGFFLAALGTMASTGCRMYDSYAPLASQAGLMPADAYAKYGPEQAQAIELGRAFAQDRAGNATNPDAEQMGLAVEYAKRLSLVSTVSADTLGHRLTISFKSGWRRAVLPIADGGPAAAADATTGASAPAGAPAPAGTPAPATAALNGADEYAVCSACHQPTGEGLPGAFPPLAGSEWITGPAEIPIAIVLHGLQGPIKVKGQDYGAQMAAWPQLSDDQIAAILTYERSSWGNAAPAVTAAEVAAVRAATASRTSPWTAADLKSAKLK